MSDQAKMLIEQLREHSRELIHANSRREAVDWMAKADDLLCKAACEIERHLKHDR